MTVESAPIPLHYIISCLLLLFFGAFSSVKLFAQEPPVFEPFKPPLGYDDADIRAEAILKELSLEEKAQLIGGHDSFFIKGFERHRMPQFYLSDATQGVHLRKNPSHIIDKSTAFPCPLALTATWNTELAHRYAKSVGEECRLGGIAVLLGPGVNIYRISQNGRNFEYFGEDPHLAARMVEQYVVGIQGTGTIATLKHFLCNNTEFHRRRTNSVVDERTLHEIYLPAFKAGIDAGAMAVMTSYNQVNGEYAGQSEMVISQLLRKDLGFKWLVMSDWWSTWDPVKTIKSGLDLEMPGDPSESTSRITGFGDLYIKTNAARLLNEGKVSNTDIDRMSKNIIRTMIAMGLYDRPVIDERFKNAYPEHEKAALQTARESIVLLRNERHVLPLTSQSATKILLTGDYVESIARGRGSAEVEGYNHVTMRDALEQEFGGRLTYRAAPTDQEIESADAVIVSVGMEDSEGWDKLFSLPEEKERNIIRIAERNPKVIVVVNAGGGVRMKAWNEKVAAILYAWYPGQNGNTALAEILSGKTSPSGKLPITIENKFEDSPGYPYLPPGEKLYTGWNEDMNMSIPMNDIKYNEGVFVGYRWYDARRITPLYHFGFGLSYTTFAYGNLTVSHASLKRGKPLTVEFTVKNTGHSAGAEIAQLYVQDVKSSVPRPVRELKGFRKVFLKPGDKEKVILTLTERDFSFWDSARHGWLAEPGEFNLLVGTSSDDVRLTAKLTLE